VSTIDIRPHCADYSRNGSSFDDAPESRSEVHAPEMDVKGGEAGERGEC
jgi:hypothetical protein